MSDQHGATMRPDNSLEALMENTRQRLSRAEDVLGISYGREDIGGGPVVDRVIHLEQKVGTTPPSKTDMVEEVQAARIAGLESELRAFRHTQDTRLRQIVDLANYGRTDLEFNIHIHEQAGQFQWVCKDDQQGGRFASITSFATAEEAEEDAQNQLAFGDLRFHYHTGASHRGGLETGARGYDCGDQGRFVAGQP